MYLLISVNYMLSGYKSTEAEEKDAGLCVQVQSFIWVPQLIISVLQGPCIILRTYLLLKLTSCIIFKFSFPSRRIPKMVHEEIHIRSHTRKAVAVEKRKDHSIYILEMHIISSPPSPRAPQPPSLRMKSVSPSRALHTNSLRTIIIHAPFESQPHLIPPAKISSFLHLPPHPESRKASKNGEKSELCCRGAHFRASIMTIEKAYEDRS